ncbi:hypothetical protein ACHWQZ_G001285 [Mnemiopsis leidyi]
MSTSAVAGTRNQPANKSWELSLYELHRQPQPAITDDTEIAVQAKDLHTELMCPICLELLRKTMTTKECLHRPDPNFDKLMSKIYPNREDYEQQQEQMFSAITKHHSQLSFQACVEESLKVQASTRHSKVQLASIDGSSDTMRWSGGQSSDEETSSNKRSRVCSASEDSLEGSVSDTAEETVEIILKPRNTNSTAESRYLKTTINASIHHIKRYLIVRTPQAEGRTPSSEGATAQLPPQPPTETNFIITVIHDGNHVTLPNNMTLETVLDSYCNEECPLEMYFAPV